MSGVDVGLARWAHVTRGSCCAALFLLSSPFHTLRPDGADRGRPPWPCVDEVPLQPSPSSWDQEGHLTRLSLLLCTGTERGHWSQG